MNETITGVILAGGQGRRMGGVDKGLQSLNGRPLVQWVLERLVPQVGTVLISANQNLTRYAEFGYPVLPDRIPDFAGPRRGVPGMQSTGPRRGVPGMQSAGPLAGLHAALSHATSPLLASVPCDSPFLPTDLVQRLRAALAAENAELAVARTGDRVHRAFCLTRRGILPKLDAFLASGERKVGLFHASLKVAEVAFDDEADAFSNINTQEELAHCEKWPVAP
ncbi:MAG: molybdenum cofactor guanylyltransferase [Rhodocyclaceae bacterium]|nr:molybdenum cofactor guanylyltransferase [Rhodocyclaceae bacterium]